MMEPEIRFHRFSNERRLAYQEYGDRNGLPVFYFHGLPASRLEAGVLHAAARDLAVRIVAPERPGFGYSDPVFHPRLIDQADDVVALADALGLENFALFGMSAGGPHALACAVRAGSRVRRIALAGSLGPCYQTWAVSALRLHGRMAFHLARYAPALLWPSYGLPTLIALRYLPRFSLQAIHAFSPPAERNALRDPIIKKLLLRSMSESMRQGPTPALQELARLGCDWGFHLQDVKVPVQIWHGSADQVVPVSHAEHYATKLPQADLKILPKQCHFSVLITHSRTVLAELKR